MKTLNQTTNTVEEKQARINQGGGGENRTENHKITRQALNQLSYWTTQWNKQKQPVLVKKVWTIVLRKKPFWDNCSEIIVLRKLFWENCSEKIVLRNVLRNVRVPLEVYDSLLECLDLPCNKMGLNTYNPDDYIYTLKHKMNAKWG